MLDKHDRLKWGAEEWLSLYALRRTEIANGEKKALNPSSQCLLSWLQSRAVLVFIIQEIGNINIVH